VTFVTSSLASYNKASPIARLTVDTSAQNELSGPLPLGAQFSLAIHGGHVVARLANGAQCAAVFSREGAVQFPGEIRRRQDVNIGARNGHVDPVGEIVQPCPPSGKPDIEPTLPNDRV
jgi:hypothetical protein